MREYTCPSGAKLIVNESPFADAKALWQALMKEMKDQEINAQSVLCTGFTSPAVETALRKCLARCQYTGTNGSPLKIDDGSFEPSACREDYVPVCIEVTMENVNPFLKSLYAGYLASIATTASTLKSKQPTTNS